ncbi:hypothetical protein Csa_000086 [Cucumis sativus]|uniref:Uncharacterized protein n=1 Tax=Cucumis sativus TaxID=3659 RepID=A0A0A0KPV5_CUCSA|nr:hypothetical protein Csa_000086 [Cucumis sativus]
MYITCIPFLPFFLLLLLLFLLLFPLFSLSLSPISILRIHSQAKGFSFHYFSGFNSLFRFSRDFWILLK